VQDCAANLAIAELLLVAGYCRLLFFVELWHAIAVDQAIQQVSLWDLSMTSLTLILRSTG